MAKKLNDTGKYSLDPVKLKPKRGEVECFIFHAPDIQHQASQDGVVHVSFSVSNYFLVLIFVFDFDLVISYRHRKRFWVKKSSRL